MLSRKRLEYEDGQSTLEAAIILAIAMSLCVLLALIWHASSDGRFTSSARESASHTLEGGVVGGLQDILAY